MLLADILENGKGKTDLEKMSELKSSGLPNYLWGDGQYSRLVIDLLDKHDISYQGIFTDSTGSGKYELLGKLSEEKAPFNIIVAHGDHTKLESFKKPASCREIVVLFDVFGFEFELDRNYLETNYSNLSDIYNALTDESSKSAWIAYLAARYSLNWKLLHPHVTSEPYFEEVVTRHREIETIIDIGAFRGDSIIKAYNEGYKWNTLYAFEPNPVNYGAIIKQLEQHHITNVVPVNLAVDKEGGNQLYMSINGDLSTASKEAAKGDNLVKIDTTGIDSFIKSASLEKVDYITYDVEGAEPDALSGTAEEIRRHKPVLKLSIYHRRNHLFELFNILTAIRKDYRFIFRVYNKLGTDACLIAY